MEPVTAPWRIKASIIRKVGSGIELDTKYPIPKPGPDQILVRSIFAPVNPVLVVFLILA
jgi:NADPH:quinone reductase-like Zn-dependent oxidoreductase